MGTWLTACGASQNAPLHATCRASAEPADSCCEDVAGKAIDVDSFPGLIPESVSDTVRLRRYRESDAPLVTEAMQDPEIHRGMGNIPSPYALENALGWIDSHDYRWHEGREAAFAVVDDTDQLLGSVSAIRPDSDIPELIAFAYWTALWARGKGVAPAALTAAVKWAIDICHFEGLCLQTKTDNAASARVAEKVGFVNLGVKDTGSRFILNFWVYPDRWPDNFDWARVRPDE